MESDPRSTIRCYWCTNEATTFDEEEPDEDLEIDVVSTFPSLNYYGSSDEDEEEEIDVGDESASIPIIDEVMDFSAEQNLINVSDNDVRVDLSTHQTAVASVHQDHIIVIDCDSDDEDVGMDESEPAPPPPHVCPMCSHTGFLVPTCPNAIYLNCGSPHQTYSSMCPNCCGCGALACSECGHLSTNCPDLWRSDLSTIDNIARLEMCEETWEQDQLFCSGCA